MLTPSYIKVFQNSNNAMFVGKLGVVHTKGQSLEEAKVINSLFLLKNRFSVRVINSFVICIENHVYKIRFNNK